MRTLKLARFTLVIYVAAYVLSSCSDVNDPRNEIRSKVSEIGVLPSYYYFVRKSESRHGDDLFKLSVFLGEYGDRVKGLPYTSVDGGLSILNCSAIAAFPDAISTAKGTLESFHSSEAARARECLKGSSTGVDPGNVWTACRAEKVLPACPSEFDGVKAR
jgi:hypothetical protein